MNLLNKVTTAPMLENSTETLIQVLKRYSFEELMDDKSSGQKEIIAPRILMPGGVIAFRGAPFVGKTKLLIAWLAHMAAGLPFLGMTTSRPLKVVYLQEAINHDYIANCIKRLKMDSESKMQLSKNFFFTAGVNIVLNDAGVDMLKRAILQHVPKVDILAIDPMYAFFGDREDDVYLHRDRIDVLRKVVHSNCGVIGVYRAKELNKQQVETGAFGDFDELRNVADCCISMHFADGNTHNTLHIENHREDSPVKIKLIAEIDGNWHEVEKMKI